MNKLYNTLLFCFTLCLVNAQKQPAKLIIRGDDMGFSHAANEALIKSYKEGVENAIEIIVPSPWFPEAVKMLAQTPSVDVGVHLCLTSEWDNVKWRPMTDCPSLKDASGYFFPKVFPDKSYPGQAILENNYTLQDIEKEFRAQIEAAKKQIPRLSHISGHMGCTNLSEDVKALTQKLAKEYNLVTDNEMAASGVLRMGYDGAHKTAQEKLESFKKALTQLEAGKTYLFVDHPAFDNDEIRAVHHIGYEDVATDRQGVTDLFTDKTLKSFLKEVNVEPISYTDWVRTRYFPKMVEKVSKMPPKNNVWVFLLAGQSNMAGRGWVEPQDTMTDKRLLTINKNNEVILAKEPLHFYEPRMAGLDCGVSFGRVLLKNIPDNVTILLIPTAIGGSSIQQWLGDSTYRGVQLLTNFKEKVKVGSSIGVIKGVLWHQGESNANSEENIRLHPERLTALFKIFRNITHNDHLPILAGELGSYSTNNKKWQLINEAIKQVVQKDAHAVLISTQDFKHKGDNVHFNSMGQRTMGERFAIDYLKMK